MHAATSSQKAVGQELAALLPDPTTPWYRKSHLLKLNFCVLSLVLFSSANGYDGSMMNGLQALPQWQEFMDTPTGAWLGLINAIQPLGSVIAYPVVAWFVNRYGRKKAIWVGYLWLILSVALQTCAQNVATFVLARFFLGQVSAWFASAAPLLITEIAYPTHRGVVTALFNCGWYVGSLVAAWATFGTRNYESSWSWRIPSVLQAAIPAIGLIGFLLSPESPRWLVAVGRVEEAKAILVKYHAGGDESIGLVAYELEEIERTLEMEIHNATSTSYTDMLKTKGNRHRLFITITLGIAGQWAGNGVVSYYLALVLETVGITSVTDQTLISGCLQIWNLGFAIAAAFCVDRLGRRVLFLSSSIIMLISYIVISGLSGSFAITGVASTGIAVIPFLFIYFAGYDIAFTPLLVSYPAEIWSYQLRARGLAVLYISTSLAVFFNIFVNPIALAAIGWKYYIVFAVILVFITLMCYFYYPETRGYTLEEMARVFDGDDAAAPVEGEMTRRLSEHPDVKRMSISHVSIEVNGKA